MPSSLKWRIPVILAVVAFAAWFTFPLSQRISLGLDLQGGTHLILKVDTSKVPAEVKDKDVAGVVVEIIRNRVDQFGVREPLIQRQGLDHILVQLPGITDRERALNLIGRTALLEFKLVSDNQRLLQQALDGKAPAGFVMAEDEQGSPLLLDNEGALTGAILSDAWVEPGEMGLPEVSFRLNKEGARLFGRLTGANINKRLAIVLDGKVQSAPTIQSRITDAGRITGRFTREQAHDLAIVLRAGALPAPISIEEERTVGPSLGRDSIHAGLTATIVGAAAVVLFMIAYYWFAGFVAIIALALNLLLILGGLGYFHATLTLPGIAGMILTLGMAVDANVLIYERIREELKVGKALASAIHAGYDKAFSAIFDSNVTTVMAAVFLYWFGTGSIRGFATTLVIGLLASMFTAIVVTRVVFDLLLGWDRLKALPMAQFFGETHFDFIAKRKWFYWLSVVLISAGAIAWVSRGDARYGIDFSGGMLQEYRFSKPMDPEKLRATLSKAGVNNFVIQQFGSANEWLIRTPDDEQEEIQKTMKQTQEAFNADFSEAAPEMIRLEQVGPTVGKILREKAWFAIAWSMVGILVYVAIRYRHWDFAAAGVIALIHDVVVAGGMLCVFHKQIDMTVIAALLTIAGFSINDTIVIYDRVRENMRIHRKKSLAEIINLSLNECLGRTVLTSLTVLFQVGALYFFGGEVLHDFALCLLFGFISGVYSTIYIASALVITWRRAIQPKAA